MWNEDFYEQEDGAAMGNPLSPVVANIYMEHFEEMALNTATKRPSTWLRYVDDTFVIWNGDRNELNEFLTHLNSLRSSIQFTMEIEDNNSLPFLDVLVTKNDSGLRTSVYRKKDPYRSLYPSYFEPPPSRERRNHPMSGKQSRKDLHRL